jgi:transposase
MIAARAQTRDGAIRRAARELGQLLKIARANLPPAAHVCPTCHHVFSADRRLDMRCPTCAAAAAEREAVRL